MKAFVNHSIFSGIIEFYDEEGQEWKIEETHVFRLIEGSWIYDGYSIPRKGESLKNRMQRFHRNEN